MEENQNIKLTYKSVSMDEGKKLVDYGYSDVVEIGEILDFYH